MSAHGLVGHALPIVMVLEDGAANQYPEVRIYAGGAHQPTAVLTMQHILDGRYEAQFIPQYVGVYSAVFRVFSDEARTIESIYYSREVEQIFVTQSGLDDLASKLIRVLGLTHENVFIDNTVYDQQGQLITARVRLFDSKEHVEMATDGGTEDAGLIATYNVQSQYESLGRMSTYRMIKQ